VVLILIVSLTAALAAGACNAPTIMRATGVVIAVDGPTAARVDRFVLRTDDGQLLEFTLGPLSLDGGGLPAPHLREHLVSGERVTVYHWNNIVQRYTDAAE